MGKVVANLHGSDTIQGVSGSLFTSTDIKVFMFRTTIQNELHVKQGYSWPLYTYNQSAGTSNIKFPNPDLGLYFGAIYDFGVYCVNIRDNKYTIYTASYILSIPKLLGRVLNSKT